MDVAIQRTDSDRSQNGGPRVSFNRDVHVKRIGPRSSPIADTPLPPPAPVFRRELPTDLSKEGIRKEAALVLAQVDSVKCTAAGGTSDIVGGRVNVKSRGPIERRRTFDYNSNKIFNKDGQSPWLNPNRFNSLPTRKKKSRAPSRPVARSVSDASSKKSASKRPSIFSIFSRKSDSNLHDSSSRGGGGEDSVDGVTVARNATGGNNIRKRVGRSKSDVGTSSSSGQQQNHIRKRNNSENEEQQQLVALSATTKKNRAPLSPIIEQSQREDYFSSRETSADAKAKLSVPAPPKRRDKRNGNRSSVSGSIAKRPEVAVDERSAQQQKQEDNILQIVPAKPVATAIKDTISTLKRSNSRANQEMHSSQLPQQKPPLTKGVTVDGMVKRLSMERFSPPPHLSGPAFSYTRPKDQIIYAQVVCDTDGKSKQTVHSSYENGTGRGPSPARNGVLTPSSSHQLNGDSVDGARQQQHHTTSQSQQNQHQQQHHHHRHNSDEDEGLGLEIKAKVPNDDFISTHDQRRYSPRDLRSASDDEFKSVAEDMPITPKIRDVPPEKYAYHSEVPARGRGDGMDGMPGNEFGDLSHRRAVLESRIQNRRFGSRDLLNEPQHGDEAPLYKNPHQPNIVSSSHHHHHQQQQEYPTGEPVRMTKLTTNRDFVKRLSPPSREMDEHHHHHPHHNQHHQNEQFHQQQHLTGPSEQLPYHRSRSTDVTNGGGRSHRYHERGSQEVLNRYSPERSHLDMIGRAKLPPYSQNGTSSKYEEESRYFHDGNEGYKETVRRETNIGPDGKPKVSETVSRERLDTPLSGRGSRVNGGGGGHGTLQREPSDDYYRDKYVKDSDSRRPNDIQHGAEDDLIARQYHHHNPQESRRHQKLQRSFDRGDSGIENDYRKDSFNDRELRPKWKQRTYDDDRRTCELFLRKERRHTVDNHPVQWTTRNGYGGGGYRERSIDDGSHFDPRLDRYNDDNNRDGTLARRSREKSAERQRTEKKKSGLEKVKQLLSGGSSKKTKSAASSSIGSSTLNRSDKLIKERNYSVDEERPRSRLTEIPVESPTTFVEPQISDISTRRRLSTPKASPALPKRSSSQKSYKSSTSASGQTAAPQPKLSWFKSLDRLSRKKDRAPSIATSSANESFNGHHHTLKPSRVVSREETTTTPSRLSQQPSSKGNSSKTLRFFGDTDLESNGSYSKATWKNKTRHQPLTSQKAISKSAYDLDTINNSQISSSRHKSASLQHLDETDRAISRQLNGRYNSKSRDLHDISESASDNELAAQHNAIKKTHHSSSLLLDGSKKSREQSPKSRSSRTPTSQTEKGRASTLSRNGKLSSYDEEETLPPSRDLLNRRSASVDARISTLSRHDYRKPPPGPQKPARTFEKRRSVSRGDRDRVQDSSGTEGDSSQVSRGSVVFLHATTVGDIPQPHWLRSRAASRESLSSKSTKNQPMTRTVSRSYSMLSPWTPRHLRDGHEINYSQQSNNHHGSKSNNAKASGTTQKQGSSSTSTLPKTKTRSNTNTMTRYKKHHTPTTVSTSSSNKRHHDQPSFDKSSSLKSSNNNNHHHNGYRLQPAAAMDRPVERRISQQRRNYDHQPSSSQRLSSRYD